MISKPSLIAAVAGALAVTLFAAPTLAQSQPQPPADPRQAISVAEVDKRLSAQGFRVLDVEWDDGKYEVLAFNAQGQCRELDVHRRTGKVLRDRADDDCYDHDERRGGAPR